MSGFDGSTLPISGGTLLGVAVYAGLSLLGGQWVAERELTRMDWQGVCEAGIRADVTSRRKPVDVVPERRCEDVIGWLGRDFSGFCRQLGNPDLNGPARRQEEAFNRKRREAENLVLGWLASKAGSQCACAASVFKTEGMISLALYAGSARFVIPPSVKNLKQSLQVSLGTPQCQAIAEAAK